MKSNSLLFLFILPCYFACDLFKPTVQSEPPIEVPAAEGNAVFDYWIHAPLHPDNRKAVSFKLKAHEATGILQVELHVFEYELYKNSDGLPSKRRRQGGQWGLLRKWEYGGEKDSLELSHTYNKGFPAQSNVEYLFRIINSNGGVSERLAVFDAGNSPWPQDKILLYSTSRQPMQETINLCFFPDTDYKTQWRSFLSDTEDLIFKGYHQNNMIENYKDLWTFYYTRQEADGLRIAIDYFNSDHYPAFMKDSIIQGIDAFALLHKNEYSDGAYLYGNISFLAQDVFTSETYNWGTAIHETAHAVFDLSDEYDGCACFEAKGGANVFSSQMTCEAYNFSQGFPADECTPLEGYDGAEWFMSEKNVLFQTQEACEAYNKSKGYTVDNWIQFVKLDGSTWYRSEEGVCIMQDDGDRLVRPFQRTCGSLIESYYKLLEKTSQASGPLVLRERQENMFGYEQIAVFEMSMKEGVWDMAVDRICYGIPDKQSPGVKDMNIQFMDEATKLYEQRTVSRPDCVHLHGYKGKDGLEAGGKGRDLIKVAYRKGMARVECQLMMEETIPAKGIEKYKYDFGNALNKKAKVFKNSGDGSKK